jgi:hypothetical protein
MPITIEVHQGGDRTAIAMLAATFFLAFAACAQVFVAIFQMRAANRQAIAAERQATAADRQVEAADRQVQATERAIEVSLQQIHSAKVLEDRRTMPWLAISLGGTHGDGLAPLRIRNQGAGPALLLAIGRHKQGTNILDERTQLALSDLSIDVGHATEAAITIAMLKEPLFVHCHSAQGTEIIHMVFIQENGRLAANRVKETPRSD